MEKKSGKSFYVGKRHENIQQHKHRHVDNGERGNAACCLNLIVCISQVMWHWKATIIRQDNLMNSRVPFELSTTSWTKPHFVSQIFLKVFQWGATAKCLTAFIKRLILRTWETHEKAPKATFRHPRSSHYWGHHRVCYTFCLSKNSSLIIFSTFWSAFCSARLFLHFCICGGWDFRWCHFGNVSFNSSQAECSWCHIFLHIIMPPCDFTEKALNANFPHFYGDSIWDAKWFCRCGCKSVNDCMK